MASARTKQDLRDLLRRYNLRATAPRLAVVSVLSASPNPMAHRDVLKVLGEMDWDPATVYRNLVKLAEAGVIKVVSRAEGMARYAVSTTDDGHHHAHFVCSDCGTVSCLPDATVSEVSAPGRWKTAVAAATIQLQGSCPDCLDGDGD